MQNPWDNDPIVEPAQSDEKPWLEDPIVEQGSSQGIVDRYKQNLRDGFALQEKAIQGASLGFSDELRSGTASLAAGALVGPYKAIKERDITAIPRVAANTYQNMQDAQKKERERIEARRPIASTAAEVTGAFATGFVGGGKSLAGKGTKELAARGAVVGAGTGGAYGIGAGEGNIVKRTANAWDEAALGAAFGAVGNLAVNAIANRFGRGATTAMTADQKAAAKIFQEAMALDHGPNRSAVMMRRWATNGGSPEELLGMLGERGQKMLRAVGLVEENKAIQALSEIRQAQSGKVSGAVSNNVAQGQKMSVSEAKNYVATVARNQAAPLYEAAYNTKVPVDFYNQRLRGVLVDPSSKRFASPARRLVGSELSAARAAGASKEALKDLADTAQLLDNYRKGQEVVLNVRALDYLKRAMGDAEGSLLRSGSLQQASAIGAQRRAIVSAVDEFAPDYAAARATWQGKSAIESAFEQGKAIIKGSGESADEFAARLNGMSTAEKQAARLAAAEAIETRLQGLADSADPTRLFKNQLFRNKLRALFADNPDEAEAFIRLVSQTDETLGRIRAVNPQQGSNTVNKAEALSEFDNALRHPVAKATSDISLSPSETAFRIARRTADSSFNKKRERVAAVLADVFFGNTPPPAYLLKAPQGAAPASLYNTAPPLLAAQNRE